jgi:RNA polymerase sigma factor (sigma-70 family)
VSRDVVESDAELLGAVASDAQAFARFYDRYERAVAGYFLRRGAVPEVAADLTAEVFAQALAAAHRYRPERPTAAMWLFSIARNTLSKSIRRGRVEARARRKLGAAVIELEVDSLAWLTAADGERWVREMLDSLPAGEREVILRRVLQERDYESIARRLKTSEMVIRKRVSRGLARLRDQIERPT